MVTLRAVAAALGFLVALAAVPTPPCAAQPAAKGGAKAAADEGPIPTMAEIRALFEQGENAAVLRAVHRLGSLRGKAAREAARAYDPAELLRMKAETYLRMKMPAKAVEAFRQAAKLAKDEALAAEFDVTAMLLEGAKGLKYVPPAQPAAETGEDGSSPKGRPAPIDLSDPAKRREAFTALLAAETRAAQPKVKAAAGSADLDEIGAAVDALRHLRMVELVATGGDEAAEALGRDLLEPATRLMRIEVDQAVKRVETIEKRATEEVVDEVYGVNTEPEFGPVSKRGGKGRVNAGTPKVYLVRRRRGLDPVGARQLGRASGECRRIATRAAALAALAGKDEGAAGEARALAEEAMSVAERADYVRRFDYSGAELVGRREERERREQRQRR